MSVPVVDDLSKAAGVDSSDVLRVVMGPGALCEFRLRFGIAQSQDGIIVQVRSIAFCVSGWFSQVMDKSLRMPGFDQERYPHELLSDIVRGCRADGTALQDPVDVGACCWRVHGSFM